MVVDARRVMIEQPVWACVYYRTLSSHIATLVEGDTGLWIDVIVHKVYWADHMPQARKLVHPY